MNRETVQALRTMIDWLSETETSPETVLWLLSLLKALKNGQRKSILMEIAHSATQNLLFSLKNLYKQTQHIFFFLLLGFQHSEAVFHASVVPHLPKILPEIGEKSVLDRLVEAVNFLMNRFPDYPELYDPIIQALTDLGLNNQALSKKRQEELCTLSWLMDFEKVRVVII